MRAPVKRPAATRRQTGFTVLELAVTVGVLGVLGMVASSTWGDYARARDRARAQGEAEVARLAVRTFVLRNRRLPCPDLTAGGSGAREGDAGGACPAGAQVGWLPYESLGLAPPVPGARMRYAVGRAGGHDLVVPDGSASDGLDLDGRARIGQTLAEAARLATTPARPFLTGAGGTGDPEDCGHVVANPAFVLVAPVEDRDAAGGTRPGFDGINAGMAELGRTCIAAPARRADARYDDVVVADSASALLGWLAAHTR